MKRIGKSARRAIRWLGFVAAGVLTVGTAGADEFEWTTYFNPNKPIDAAVYGGRVWLASTRAAVTVYDISDSSFTTVHRRPGLLASNSVGRVIADGSGRLWFGTAASGVSVLDVDTSDWELLTRFDGLPSDTVQTIARWGDSMWVGTPSGFAVFHGGELIARCNVYVPPATRCPLENFNIRAIAPLAGGAYLGTSAGVSWYDGQEETPLGRPWTLGVVEDLVIAGGTLCVLVTGGPYLWDEGSSRWVAAVGGISSPSGLRRLAVISGVLYAAGSTGVYRYDGPNWTRVGNQFNAIAVAGTGGEDMWAAGSNGLYGYTGSEWVHLSAPGPPVDNISSIAVGPGGEVWMTGPSWTTRFDEENWEPVSAFTTNYKLQTCATHGILVDSRNRVWFGHCCRRDIPDSCRVDRLSREEGSQQWHRYDVQNVWRVAEGGGSTWLAGRYDGLFRIDEGSDVPFNIRAGVWPLSSNELSSLTFDAGVGLWIGHRQQGVDLFRGAVSGIPSDWDHIDEENDGLLSNGVRKVLLKDDELWVGTLSGVSVVDRAAMTVVRNYTVGPGGMDDKITDVSGLAVDGYGDVWVSTAGGGVYLIESDRTIQSFNERNSPVTSNSATDVAYDPFEDVTWIATSSGINRVSRTKSGVGESKLSLYVYPSPFCPEGCDGASGGPLKIGGVPAPVNGEVVDLKGQIMARFFDARAGDSIWDGTDTSGRPAGSGLYFVVVRLASQKDRVPVALVR